MKAIRSLECPRRALASPPTRWAAVEMGRRRISAWTASPSAEEGAADDVLCPDAVVSCGVNRPRGGARRRPLWRRCAPASPAEVCGGLWGGGLGSGAAGRSEIDAVAWSGKLAARERKREEKEMKGKIGAGGGLGAGSRGCGGRTRPG
jgi:hypothetical protein